MIYNVNQNASRTYQVNRSFEVVVVFVHAIIVVWAALPLTFCVIFQNVIIHKPRFKWINNPKLISMESAKTWHKAALTFWMSNNWTGNY